MPISHKYKLIFIHIPKCAGISMWHALDLDVNPDNLISTSSPVLQHLLPKQLKGKYIDKKTWNLYKKFTIIRNPYDRVVSDYFWMKEHIPHLVTGDFDDFLSLREDVVLNNKYDLDMYYDHFYPMYFYFENIKYDHVIRFEDIEPGFEEIRSLYTITNVLTKNNQSSSEGYLLNAEQKNRIYSLYKKDFIQFGYKKQSSTNANKNNVLSELNKSQKTIEEKITLINQLETKLKNIQNNSVDKINSINPIHYTSVKIFWSKSDGVFSEEKSVTQPTTLNWSEKKITLQIPPSESDIEYLRFDIGEQVGIINIHTILIRDSNEAVVWEFNSEELFYKENIILIKSQEHWGKNTVQISTNNDPQFIIHTKLLTNEIISNKHTIEIILSTLDNNQFVLLNSVLKKPLSFISEKENFELKTNLNALRDENEKRAIELITIENENENYKKRNENLSVHVETLNNVIKELNKDKDTILTESKQNVNTIVHEKEQKENKVIELENSLKELNKTNQELQTSLTVQFELNNQLLTDKVKQEDRATGLENRLTENNKTIQELQKSYALQVEKNNQLLMEKTEKENAVSALENRLAEINKATQELKITLSVQVEKNNQLLGEKEKITTDLITVEKTLQETVKQNSELISSVGKQQNYIEQINDEKQQLNNLKNELVDQLTSSTTYNNQLNHELNKNAEEIKALQSTINELNKKITDYENKKLFDTIIYKLSKKRNKKAHH